MSCAASMTNSSRSRSSQLAGGHLPIHVLEREHPEGHVPRLVADHELRDLVEQALVRVHELHHPEGREREPFDHDLHAEVGHVPARLADDLGEERVEVRVHREGDRQLLGEVPSVHLHVARLVRHLARGVELGLRPRDGVHDLRGGEERALLAVEELREHPAELVHPHADQLLDLELLGRVEDRVDRLGRHEVREALGVHVDRPVDVGRGVPLQALALLVSGCRMTGRSPWPSFLLSTSDGPRRRRRPAR
jgi:hypothetical protein